ncbi:WhiB family transcriptional regulator [Aeromicrobium sp.]|uniref:WhiB family transcriptional regulator n=1 Tax=Aeromicrobium sp. TaxID=1871063 RepID=UPI002FC66DE0
MNPFNIETPAWMSDARCAEIGGEPFFEEVGASSRQAIAICHSCPVREQCLQYALDNHEAWGLWGGLLPLQRQQLKKGAA